MFEIGTTAQLWEIARKHPLLSHHPFTLKPLGYAHMINLIENFKPSTMLEVGHGTGSFIFRTFKDKCEMWGLDDELEDSRVSAEGMIFFKEINPHVKFVKGLLGNNTAELPDNYFDFVCSVSVIEHIPHENLKSVFEETYRILKPGGIVSHSYDVYVNQNTKPVFDAFENAKFEWLKPKKTMNVYWEQWLEMEDEDIKEKMLTKIVFENPLFVAENYMWQTERKLRGTPPNYVTILAAAKKPEEKFIASGQKANIVPGSSVPESFEIGNDNIFISDKNFTDFTYSKNTHFELFKKNGFDKELFGSEVDPDYNDLKVYQDLLIYSYVKQNLKKGSRILELGKGTSRVLELFKNEYECWKIHKQEEDEQSNTQEHIKLINDEMGNFNKDLPNNYFDLIFSISTFIYKPESGNKYYENMLKDINRLLVPGGISIQCLVALWMEPIVSVPYIMDYFIENQKMMNEIIPFFKITIDPDLYVMSEKFYNATWKKNLVKTYSSFGKPFSYNLFWKKENI